MQKKLFWIMFTVVSTIADFELPLLWGLLSMIPIVIACWWLIYRSGWFDFD